jgi:hypothetical protein
VMHSQGFRRAIGELPGYDASETGAMVPVAE